ncbi:MAG: SGNH/GDSL hydrolase family protein [Anaerolineales bacterium]
MHAFRKIIAFFLFLTACSTALPAPTQIAPSATLPSAGRLPTLTAQSGGTLSLSSTPSIVPAETTPTPNTPPPELWMEWPVVPTVSARMKEIYRQGLAQGRNPYRFSKIGDCQNVESYFLSVFDHPGEYSLGTDYTYLQPTIDHFRGSWSRTSLAVKGGFNVAAVLAPFRADPSYCRPDESPLDCELRVYNPSIVIISMETWWGKKPAETYERYLRQIVERVLAQGVVPILATKADNLEGDHSINLAIARVAYDYQVPLWNFWRAVQPLPNHGLSPDGFHLTFSRNFFDDPLVMQNAWPWRNLTALQSIDAVWRGLNDLPMGKLEMTPTPIPFTATPTVWQEWPILPSGISDKMKEAYQKGIEAGNNPRAFSKIGDGNASASWFLDAFDQGNYDLGDYAALQATVDYFSGSFARRSLAAGSGFTTVTLFEPARSQECLAEETRLDCELRLHRPSFALILFGTSEAYSPDKFESGMRRILDHLLAKGVVPVLFTKADNREGDHRINAIIVNLAQEYQVPLVNFWRAVQPLPRHGLQPDGEHITWGGNFFGDPLAMQNAWPWRNLLTLQMLDLLRQSLSR